MEPKFKVGDHVKVHSHGESWYGTISKIEDVVRDPGFWYIVKCDDGDGFLWLRFLERDIDLYDPSQVKKGGFDMSNVTVDHSKPFSDAMKEYQELNNSKAGLLEIVFEITGRPMYGSMTLDQYIVDCEDRVSVNKSLGIKLIFEVIREIDEKIKKYDGMKVVEI